MILVVGGYAAGKRAYVKEAFGYTEQQMADGILDDRPVVYNLQDLATQSPDDCLDFLPELCKKQVVISNEVGSGVIPVAPSERAGREATGRLCNALAREADTVIRIVSGLPVVIKGS